MKRRTRERSDTGLNQSDAIRVHLMRVADEQCFPFDVLEVDNYYGVTFIALAHFCHNLI